MKEAAFTALLIAGALLIGAARTKSQVGSGESLTQEDATYERRKSPALPDVRTVCELPTETTDLPAQAGPDGRLPEQDAVVNGQSAFESQRAGDARDLRISAETSPSSSIGEREKAVNGGLVQFQPTAAWVSGNACATCAPAARPAVRYQPVYPRRFRLLPRNR